MNKTRSFPEGTRRSQPRGTVSIQKTSRRAPRAGLASAQEAHRVPNERRRAPPMCLATLEALPPPSTIQSARLSEGPSTIRTRFLNLERSLLSSLSTRRLPRIARAACFTETAFPVFPQATCRPERRRAPARSRLPPPQRSSRRAQVARLRINTRGADGAGPRTSTRQPRRARSQARLNPAIPLPKTSAVKVVVDPPWDRSRLSEAAMLQLGMY